MVGRCFFSLQLLLLNVQAQDQQLGPPVDFSVDFPLEQTEERLLNVVYGTFLLDAELGLETNFEDIDRVVKATIGSICQYSPVESAPVVVARFLDMQSLAFRRKTFRFEWSLLPQQSHPLPGDCMSMLAQMSFGPSVPPYEEVGRSPPAIRQVFAMELASFAATRALDSSYWGLTLGNVSCLPARVTRILVESLTTGTTTTPLPTHVCDGRMYATGGGEESGFDPTMVSDCSVAQQDPCLCAAMDYCEWQPGSGEIPGGCAATKYPGVTCEACPFQSKCVEPDQSTVCADKTVGCDCAMARATKFGYGCLFVNGGCVARSTPNSAATSCDDCPSQIRCGTPRIEQVRPEEGHQLGELGIWSIEVDFDRPIELANQVNEESGVQLLCDLFEENGGKTFWVSKWMVSAKNTTLEINLKELANDYRRTCFLTIAGNIVFSAASRLPHGGLQTGQYLFYLPDTQEPTIRTFDPPNSVRGLSVDIQVKLTWSEPVARGRVMSARRVDLYRSGDELSNVPMVSFDFTAKEVALTQTSMTVDLTGFLEPNKFYSLALPPHCINDFSGNNFTGLPANVYIFGTAIDSVDADIDWQDTLWITLGVVIVVLLFFIGGAVAYLVMQSGQKNARIFSRAVRKTSKKPSQVAPIYVEDVDDGFYHQPSPVTNSQAGNVTGANADCTPIESFRATSKVGVAWEGGSKTPKLLSPTGADAVLRSSSKVSLAGITAHSKTSESPGQNLEVLARSFSKMSLQSTARVAAPVVRSPAPPTTKPVAELAADLPRGNSKVSLAWEGPKSLGSAVLRPDLEASLPRSGSKLKLPDVSAKRSSSRSISPGGRETLRGGSKMSVQSASGHDAPALASSASGPELHVARTFSKMSVHSAGRTELPPAREARSPRPSPRGAGGRAPSAR